MKLFFELVVQISEARLLMASSRFATSPKTLTTTELEIELILVAMEVDSTFSSAPATMKEVTGSKEKEPAPTEAKSYKEATGGKFN